MSQLTLYNAAGPVRDPRKAGALTKLERLNPAWPLGQTPSGDRS